MTRTKKILVIGIPVLIAIGVAATDGERSRQEVPGRDGPEGRTDRSPEPRHRHRQDGGAAQGRPLGQRDGPDREPRGARGRRGQEGRLPAADRPHPAPGDRRRGRGVVQSALLRSRCRPCPGRGGQEELRARRALVQGPDHPAGRRRPRPRRLRGGRRQLEGGRAPDRSSRAPTWPAPRTSFPRPRCCRRSTA